MQPGRISEARPKTLANAVSRNQVARQCEQWFCCGNVSDGVVVWGHVLVAFTVGCAVSLLSE